MTPNEALSCIKARRKAEAYRTYDLATLIGQNFCIIYNNVWNKKKIKQPQIEEIYPDIETIYCSDEELEEKARIEKERKVNLEQNRLLLMRAASKFKS